MQKLFFRTTLFIFLIILLVSLVSASAVTRYVAGVAKVTDNNVEFIVADRLGSERIILNESGDVNAEYLSLPYGQTIIDNGSKYGFTGKEKDVSTNLHYFGARYYDSDVGRFTGVDPVASNHAYVYVSNKPMNYVDPTGMEGLEVEGEEALRDIIKHFVDNTWMPMIEDDLPNIISLSESTGVPAEAILSAILVEDIRWHNPDFKAIFSSSSIKALKRKFANKILGDQFMNSRGYNSQPKEGDSTYGMIHCASVYGAITYLDSLVDLSEGTKSLFESFPTDKDEFREFYFHAESNPAHAVLTLKLHMEYWKNSGYDLFTYDFKTADSLGDRIGVLETLNAIGIYDYENEDYMVGTNIKYNPHDSPELGGTKLWNRFTYGEVAKVFVDSGIAKQILETE